MHLYLPMLKKDIDAFRRCAILIGFDEFVVHKFLYTMTESDVDIYQLMYDERASLLIYGWEICEIHMQNSSNAVANKNYTPTKNVQTVMKWLARYSLDLWLSREWDSCDIKMCKGLLYCMRRVEHILTKIPEVGLLNWDDMFKWDMSPWTQPYISKFLIVSSEEKKTLDESIEEIEQPACKQDIDYLREENIFLIMTRLVKMIDSFFLEGAKRLSMRVIAAWNAIFERARDIPGNITPQIPTEFKQCVINICHIYLMMVYEMDSNRGFVIDNMMNNIRFYHQSFLERNYDKPFAAIAQLTFTPARFIALACINLNVSINNFIEMFSNQAAEKNFSTLFGVISQSYISYILGNQLMEINNMNEEHFNENIERYKNIFNIYIKEREVSEIYLKDQLLRRDQQRTSHSMSQIVKVLTDFESKFCKGNRSCNMGNCENGAEDEYVQTADSKLERDRNTDAIFENMPNNEEILNYVYRMLADRTYDGWHCAKIVLLLKIIGIEVNVIETWRYHPGLTTNFMLGIETKLSKHYEDLALLFHEHFFLEQEFWLTAFYLNPIRKYYAPVIRCGMRFHRILQHIDGDTETNVDSADKNEKYAKYGLLSSTIDVKEIVKIRNHDTPNADYDALSKSLSSLKLSEQTVKDLLTVTFLPRNKSFAWAVNWDELRKRCKKLLKVPQLKRRLVELNMAEANDRLKYLNINYEKYKNRPQLDYGSIEEGYENPLNFSNKEQHGKEGNDNQDDDNDDDDDDDDLDDDDIDDDDDVAAARESHLGFDEYDDDDDDEDDDMEIDKSKAKIEKRSNDDKECAKPSSKDIDQLVDMYSIGTRRTRARTAAALASANMNIDRTKIEEKPKYEEPEDEPDRQKNPIKITNAIADLSSDNHTNVLKRNLKDLLQERSIYSNATPGFKAFPDIWDFDANMLQTVDKTSAVLTETENLFGKFSNQKPTNSMNVTPIELSSCLNKAVDKISSVLTETENLFGKFSNPNMTNSKKVTPTELSSPLNEAVDKTSSVLTENENLFGKFSNPNMTNSKNVSSAELSSPLNEALMDETTLSANEYDIHEIVDFNAECNNVNEVHFDEEISDKEACDNETAEKDVSVKDVPEKEADDKEVDDKEPNDKEPNDKEADYKEADYKDTDNKEADHKEVSDNKAFAEESSDKDSSVIQAFDDEMEENRVIVLYEIEQDLEKDKGEFIDLDDQEMDVDMNKAIDLSKTEQDKNKVIDLRDETVKYAVEEECKEIESNETEQNMLEDEIKEIEPIEIEQDMEIDKAEEIDHEILLSADEMYMDIDESMEISEIPPIETFEQAEEISLTKATEDALEEDQQNVVIMLDDLTGADGTSQHALELISDIIMEPNNCDAVTVVTDEAPEELNLEMQKFNYDDGEENSQSSDVIETTIKDLNSEAKADTPFDSPVPETVPVPGDEDFEMQSETITTVHIMVEAVLAAEEATLALEETVVVPEEAVLAAEEAVLAAEEAVLAAEEAVLATVEAVPASEETVLSPEEAVIDPEEAVLPPEETVLAPEAVIDPEKAVLAPEEEGLAPEEAVVAPEEAVIAPEEAVVAPKEAVLAPEEVGLLPEEVSLLPEEVGLLPEEVGLLREEAVLSPEEAVIVPEEAVLLPEEAVLAPEEAVLVPEEAVLLPEVAVLAPEKAVIIPEEAVLLPEDAVHASEYVEEASSGSENPPNIEIDSTEAIGSNNAIEIINELIQPETSPNCDTLDKPCESNNQSKKLNKDLDDCTALKTQAEVTEIKEQSNEIQTATKADDDECKEDIPTETNATKDGCQEGLLTETLLTEIKAAKEDSQELTATDESKIAISSTPIPDSIEIENKGEKNSNSAAPTEVPNEQNITKSVTTPPDAESPVVLSQEKEATALTSIKEECSTEESAQSPVPPKVLKPKTTTKLIKKKVSETCGKKTVNDEPQLNDNIFKTKDLLVRIKRLKVTDCKVLRQPRVFIKRITKGAVDLKETAIKSSTESNAVSSSLNLRPNRRMQFKRQYSQSSTTSDEDTSKTMPKMKFARKQTAKRRYVPSGRPQGRPRKLIATPRSPSGLKMRISSASTSAAGCSSNAAISRINENIELIHISSSSSGFEIIETSDEDLNPLPTNLTVIVDPLYEEEIILCD